MTGNELEINLNGYHATSKTKGTLIRNFGFQLSPTGRAGSGVYFWEEQDGWQELSRAWHQHRLTKGAYGGDKDATVDIIKASLKTTKLNFTDFLTPIFKEMIENLGDHRPKTMQDFYGNIARQYEVTTGHKVKLIRVRVCAPNAKLKASDGSLPVSLLAKDLDVIHIEN